MHRFPPAAEDYATRNDGPDADNAATVATVPAGMTVGSTFKSPFGTSAGAGNSGVGQATWTATLASGTTRASSIAYGDSVLTRYPIAGRGKRGDLSLIL